MPHSIMRLQKLSIGLCMSVLLVAIGCQQGNESGLSDAQEKMGNDVSSWAKASGGDWNKLSNEQKQTMVKSVGSEASAKMVLQYAAHRPEPIAPGPPPGWKPGGPPPTPPKSPPSGQ